LPPAVHLAVNFAGRKGVSVIIERIQIDGGFLDNLDLKLAPGLNVIIGGRGTGKTSIIELLRFCLNIPAQTSEAGRQSADHALSVLRDGRVTVTLRDGDDHIAVSRAAVEDRALIEEVSQLPALFSQKEIESLGLSASARISLIDSFVTGLDELMKPKDSLHKQIGSLTTEIATLLRDIEGLENQLTQLPKLEAELVTLAKEERAVANLSRDVAEKQKTLQALAETTAGYSIQQATLNRTSSTLARWVDQIASVVDTTPEVEEWPDRAGEDKLQSLRGVVSRAKRALQEVKVSVSDATTDLGRELSAIQRARVTLEDKARTLRKEIEGLEKGSGEIAKRGNALREKIASLRATAKLLETRRERYNTVLMNRGKLLDDYEKLHQVRFKKRQQVAADLNNVLSPQIKIEIRQASDYDQYVSAIVNALRGSGLRYNELGPLIARSISPRELVEAVERRDIEFFASNVELARDRAGRLVGALSELKLESILTVNVEDDAVLQLLDGRDYKDVQHLSVGQRCTVVLPIVLEHADRVLVVDQPEDHLDNAFIVDTFIKAIRSETRPKQMIFSTHNANIPVLGEAERVFVLKSTGERGFVAAFGALEDKPIVEAITTVMEGGLEAFETRARFYRAHSVK
jgi:energy-coupling factor transporter ATP-binding protein EcfA2